jgi:hypothetical protein
MIRFCHLNYHCHQEYADIFQVLEKHRPTSLFTEPLSHHTDFHSIKHLNNEGNLTIDRIHYYFFKSRNRSWWIPFKTHSQIKKLKPDIVLVEGFVFPLQVLMLRRKLGKKVKIIAQHHGEQPWKE